jgi:hypothetical protein
VIRRVISQMLYVASFIIKWFYDICIMYVADVHLLLGLILQRIGLGS